MRRRLTASGRRTYSGTSASRSRRGRPPAPAGTRRGRWHACSGEASAGTCGRRLQPVAKAYRPVPHRQPRRVARIGAARRGPRARGPAGPGAARRRGRPPRTPRRGVRRAPPGPAGRCSGRRGQRLERRDGDDLGARRLGQRARGRDADPQAGEGAGPDADADPAHVGEVRPDGLERAARQRQQLGRRARAARPAGGSWRSSTGSPSSGSTATTVAGVAVSSPRITSR